MAPAVLDAAEARWQTQLADMRAALADLKLPQNSSETLYDSDIAFDDDDFTSGNSGDDVWDFISDNEEDLYSSDSNVDHDPPIPNNSYGPQWLKSKCLLLSSRKQGLQGEDLQEQIMALLASDSVEEELQSTLTDIIGFDDLDFVIELISHRRDLTAPSPFAVTQDDSIFGKLQTKRQREEALRRRDYEHKNATLGPSLNRDGPQYPHVYKSHTTGNLLDHRGRKYGLPAGSERMEHAVSTRSYSRFNILETSLQSSNFADMIQRYEEYSIPAAKVGTLGVGRQLVKISEMDGLCRKTFRGYKTLNRMQSLVYPVAYQTSENMLICAPTGAVGRSCPSILICL
jgi:antiviral helicase SLH1